MCPARMHQCSRSRLESTLTLLFNMLSICIFRKNCPVIFVQMYIDFLYPEYYQANLWRLSSISRSFLTAACITDGLLWLVSKMRSNIFCKTETWVKMAFEVETLPCFVLDRIYVNWLISLETHKNDAMLISSDVA